VIQSIYVQSDHIRLPIDAENPDEKATKAYLEMQCWLGDFQSGLDKIVQWIYAYPFNRRVVGLPTSSKVIVYESKRSIDLCVSFQ